MQIINPDIILQGGDQAQKYLLDSNITYRYTSATRAK